MTNQPLQEAAEARAEVRRAAEVGLRVLHGEQAEQRAPQPAIWDRALLAVELGYERSAAAREAAAEAAGLDAELDDEPIPYTLASSAELNDEPIPYTLTAKAEPIAEAEAEPEIEL